LLINQLLLDKIHHQILTNQLLMHQNIKLETILKQSGDQMLQISCKQSKDTNTPKYGKKLKTKG